MKLNLTLMKFISCFLLAIFIFWHNFEKMFHLASTVLNNTGLEQVYLYLFKHYTLLVKTTTVK